MFSWLKNEMKKKIFDFKNLNDSIRAQTDYTSVLIIVKYQREINQKLIKDKLIKNQWYTITVMHTIQY